MADVYLALSALGPDKKGLVAQLTKYLAEHKANVEESHMAILGGEFGMLMLVSATKTFAEKMQKDLASLSEKTGLHLKLSVTKSPSEHRQSAMPYRLIADAADNEGIIGRIADTCAQHGLNVVSLKSESYPAPVTAVPLFRMNAVLDVPQTAKISALREALAKVAEENGIDLELRAERH